MTNKYDKVIKQATYCLDSLENGKHSNQIMEMSFIIRGILSHFKRKKTLSDRQIDTVYKFNSMLITDRYNNKVIELYNEYQKEIHNYWENIQEL